MKEKKCKNCKILHKALKHECEEANVLAEFIGKKGLSEEYCEWSKTKFKKL